MVLTAAERETWKGLAEHSLDGWNIGPTPCRYAPHRGVHPAPVKADQGRFKARLGLDPARARVVEQISPVESCTYSALHAMPPATMGRRSIPKPLSLGPRSGILKLCDRGLTGGVLL